MLATPWESPFVDDGWLFELKWDGVRCLLSVEDGDVKLHSRAGNDMTGRYPEIAGAGFPSSIVLDGEIVAFDDRGNPSFERLQGATRRQVETSLVVFDVLHEGGSLIDMPLARRLERLDSLELPPNCATPDRVIGDSTVLWEFVTKRRLEGIVAKRLDSVYRPGTRSPDWRKIGRWSQVRAVVGGFTPGIGGRASTFGALLLGLWTDVGLRWVGSVGSGFDDDALRAIRSALDEMTVTERPFLADPELPSTVTWVSPQLVAVVRFKQWTAAGRLRAPSFKGFSDYPLQSVTWSSEGPAHAE